MPCYEPTQGDLDDAEERAKTRDAQYKAERMLRYALLLLANKKANPQAPTDATKAYKLIWNLRHQLSKDSERRVELDAECGVQAEEILLWFQTDLRSRRKQEQRERKEAVQRRKRVEAALRALPPEEQEAIINNAIANREE